MKLFGRRPERYILGLKRLPQFIMASWRALFIFKQPLTVIWSYIVRRSPAGRMVQLKSGHVIHLSGDPADIVTVFLIFGREDYGKISPGANVIDIGANIGVFSLFAALSGAKGVYAFEPSASSYDVLLKNIEANGLGSIIKAERLAVVGFPSPPVRFPRNSDVMNAILPDSSDSDDYDLVPTITLSEMVSAMSSVDILKSDCEGGEYAIFLQADEADIRKITEIRMEIHRGPKDELVSRLVGLGYRIREYMSEPTGVGYIWITRGNAA